MAGIQKTTSGAYQAVWRDVAGKRIVWPTGETDEARAREAGARFEAEFRFWEDHAAGVWQRLADASFSPRYLHSIFTGRESLTLSGFSELLKQAGVRIAAPSKWQDRPKRKQPATGPRWHWEGEERCLEELHALAADGVTRAALRFRLGAGWSVSDALSTPLMTRAESGLIGAKRANIRRGAPPESPETSA